MSLAECSGLGGARRVVRVRGVGGIPPQVVIPIITPITTHLPPPCSTRLCAVNNQGGKDTSNSDRSDDDDDDDVEKDHIKEDHSSDSLTREKAAKSERETTWR